ncbi:hypothetical protein CK203_017683 [Vitis vinifera]|uniref:Uncharacterized protein n=1 Tax=Vitis vinifera TaxID=29760 RepID=A0A438JH26_VITVI|nr:hypothetical protein CK203_017683 [Vitis vinifera]
MLMLWRKDEKCLFSPSLSFHIHLLTSSINSFTPSCSQIPKFQFHPESWEDLFFHSDHKDKLLINPIYKRSNQSGLW